MENVSLIDHASGNRFSNGCKLSLVLKKNNELKFADMTSSSVCFGFTVLLLLSLITGPSFVSNITTGCRVMKVFVYKRLTKNSKIRNNSCIYKH